MSDQRDDPEKGIFHSLKREESSTVYTPTSILSDSQMDKSKPYPRFVTSANNNGPTSTGHVRRSSGPNHLPRSITLQSNPGVNELGLDRDRQRTLERQNTLSLATGPAEGNRGARTIADFRTMSIHVTDTIHVEREKQQEKMEKLTKKMDKKEHGHVKGQSLSNESNVPALIR